MHPPPQDGNSRWVILFDSIHHVLAAEQVFKQHGVWCDLVPAPRTLSPHCGMAIEFRKGHRAAVARLLGDARIKTPRVYRFAAGGYERVTGDFTSTSWSNEEA